MLRDKDTGSFVEPSKEYMGKYLDTWLETAAKARVRAKTFQNYKDLVRLYIKPALGETKLSVVTPEQIQSFYNKMLLEDGLSPKTIKNVHGVLRNSLEQAVKWGKLYRNPADLVDLPRQTKKEMQAFSPEEANRFLNAVIYSRFKALFALLVTTGMRPGEALALKWKDIDVEGCKVTVNRTLTRVGGGWSLEEPKTARSRRTIPIPGSVLQYLKS
jgi:integrase